MAATQSTVFLLWGYRCDEVATVTLISGLRRAGLRVKLVAIRIRDLVGAYGVALQPDLLLNEALPLAGKALCVILPFDAATLQRISGDQRLLIFVQTAHANRAWFVAQTETVAPLRSLLDVTQQGEPEELITYSSGDDLAAFVNQLALGLLASKSK